MLVIALIPLGVSLQVLALPNRPKKMAVIGGGYIAVEFAGIYNNFGTEVHLMFRQKLPLGGFDTEVTLFYTLNLLWP